MELIDLYDRQKRNMNKIFDRWSGEPEIGEYKQSIHIWILNSKGELLIQKRAESRVRNPRKMGIYRWNGRQRRNIFGWSDS